MKMIPNGISCSRMILVLILLAVKPLSAAFYVIYAVCGLSDMVDGWIARKTGTTSRLGEKLDSLADLTMTGVLFIILYPVVDPPAEIIVWVMCIGLVRMASMAVALKKYNTFSILHTYGNKITGMLLFLFPFPLPYIHSAVLMSILCAAASLSAIEELIIHLTSDKLEGNRKSLFTK
ncbi:CDP-alcohol phosphatidyltransferase family protein [Paenibacillus sp. 7124]|uniref:Phosphatidylglycerophosphate synthase n=1 Tax=Paenibacillus apii TaxID=1850370 RepID=A0A6M1PIT8_9BACL|nr:CDP-alcohol phosphatidyltransferase family protein [Paenibacillus apii]NGM82245.1 CDP-alcohol phosphatidyltransferase family protein [Paenibacillus apii]